MADPLPFDLEKQDATRLRLRETRRKVFDHAGGGLDLPTIPGVQSLALAIRYIDGGRIRFIEYMQLAMLNGLPNATKWWTAYADLLPGQRITCSYDDVCAASGVRPSELMAEMVTTAMEQAIDVGNLVAASVHPAIVHQAGKSAKRIGGQHAEIGFKDRMLMLQARGFAPTPKGVNVNVHASANAQAAAVAAADPSVPSFADDLAALTPAREAVQRQLMAPAADLDPIDVEALPDLQSIPVEQD